MAGQLTLAERRRRRRRRLVPFRATEEVSVAVAIVGPRREGKRKALLGLRAGREGRGKARPVERRGLEAEQLRRR
jgi:hypothetical protein